MFETVALALDGSEQSEAAIPVAKELAKQSGGKLVVIHIDERMVAKGDMPPVHPDESEIVDKVKAKADEIKGEGMDVEIQLDSSVVGGPATKIASIAEEAGAGVIVIGSRGESALKGMLVGSVAHKLLHVASVPVLVVPVR